MRDRAFRSKFDHQVTGIMRSEQMKPRHDIPFLGPLGRLAGICVAVIFLALATGIATMDAAASGSAGHSEIHASETHSLAPAHHQHADDEHWGACSGQGHCSVAAILPEPEPAAAPAECSSRLPQPRALPGFSENLIHRPPIA